MISVRFGPDDVRRLPGAQTFTTGDEGSLPRITVPTGVEVIVGTPLTVGGDPVMNWGVPLVLADGLVESVEAVFVNGVPLHHRGLQPVCPKGYAMMEHEPDADGIRFTAIKLGAGS